MVFSLLPTAVLAADGEDLNASAGSKQLTQQDSENLGDQADPDVLNDSEDSDDSDALQLLGEGLGSEMSGNCGAVGSEASVQWALTQNNTDSENPTYTLTISGNGAMADYYAQYVQRASDFSGDIAPWRRALLSDPSVERTTEDVVPITEVKIGDGVTRIGSGAFAYTELTGTVTFSKNVTSYGDGVFARDTSIKAVDWTNFKPTEKIRDGWATVYEEKHIAVPYAFFDGCSSLDTSIVDGITYSGQLVLPDTIEAIYVAAFRGTGFSTVDFSDGLSSIQAVGSYAITKLANMTEFTYPGNVAFYGTNDEGQNNVIQGGGIEKLTIAKEVTELPANFCTNTEKLTAIEFESGSQLTKIGKMAFYGTQALKSIDIPSTVTSIGESAFADCFSLEKIELGQIASLEQNTFARCSSLETAKIQGSPSVIYPSNMFGTWGSGHSAAPLKTLEIGAGEIQFDLSRQKDSIETIVLGDGVTAVPARFAVGCTKLTSVSLPDALISVPAYAFNGCSSLAEVGISENSKLQSIGNGAFANSALTQIYIPKNVTSIGEGAFNRTPITVFDMSDVLADNMTVGLYAINNWYSKDEQANWPAWKDNFKYIYVSNSGAANSVKAKTSNCNYAFFVTNGGSVDATKTGFAAVYREGYTAQWFETENFTGSPVTGTPATGKTYYAKWIEHIPEPPTEFDNEQLARMQVNVKCETDTAHAKICHFSELDGCYSTSEIMTDSNGGYYVTVTLNRSSVVEKFNKDEAAGGKTHDDTEPNAITSWTWTWDANDKVWSMDTAPITDAWATIVVKCNGSQPETPPTKPGVLEGGVTFECENADKAHAERPSTTYTIQPSDYDSISEVQYDAEKNQYYVLADVTLNSTYYLNLYNNWTGATHRISDGQSLTLTSIRFNYEKSTAPGGVANWTQELPVPVVKVTCAAELIPVELVIFRNGDTSKAYKTVRVANVEKGTVIKAADYPIGKYYDGTNSGGNYDFYGWYDDGLWNIYKQDLTKQLDGLTTKTVNGWTNLKCMVYDYENVVYYMSDADRVADNRLFATTARKGAALPTADAPTATRPGYTFKFWSREGQIGTDVTGQTVNGWTNLVANWEVTPHNIYAYARLNSYFAPLTTKEFDTPVTLNAATLSRLGLGSYNGLGYISIGSFDFDAVPLAGDQYFGNDAELDAVVTELAESIALENSVSEDTAEKIAWTVLYKTVNEEDMAPGYPAEDGYQLSGNLDLATVMFKAGGDNVENMPAVNYTYDNIIEIHDFYFAGDTFTLPADPTREGYSFEGWSVEVISAENDADHLDADGSDDAADEKLLKAGDTYTITADGVIFTAQWKLNTYIIASTLRINGNETVKETGKTYSWSHRYGGDFGVTIDYTDMFKALKDKTLEVDAENEPYDAEIKLCFPGSKDRLFNDEILTYGQEGGGWNPGVKNTAYIWGYATTSYEVIFNSDGGSAVDTKIVKYGEKTVKPEDPTMKGYNFLGWFDKDGNPFDFNTEITHKTELTAQWEKKDYIIASDLRVNNGDPVKDEGKTYSWTHRYGGKYEEIINYQPMFDALKARALEADKANEPNQTKVDVELRFPGSKDRLFNEEIQTYGQDGGGWNPGVKNTAYIWGYAWTYYDVTFVTPEGATTVDAKLIRNGEKAEKPDEPTKEGWKFLGWYADAAFKTKFDFNAPITKKTSVYAKFELVSTPIGDTYVRYDVLHIKQLPDGSYDLANAEVEHLSAKKDTAVTAVVKDYSATHHINVNSTLSKLTDTAIQPYPGADGKPVYTILTVYYDLDFHTLTFDAKGGTETGSIIVRHGNTVAKPEDPKRSGYRFNGWFDDETCREKHDFDAPLVENATVYAGWTKRSSGSSVQIESPNKPKKDNSLKFNTEDHFAFVNGYPDGTVKPTGDVTRAEVAAILYRVMDADCVKTYETTRCSFSDVVRGDWFNLYVATLENADVIVDTRTNGKFRPNEAITRAELAAMLAQFADIKSAANSFNDVSARHWASDEIAVCAKLGWINGYPDGTFRPDQTVTRAEMMAMINRALDRTPKSVSDLLSGMKTWSDNANVNAWYYLDVQEATNSHTYTKSGTHETWKKLR